MSLRFNVRRVAPLALVAALSAACADDTTGPGVPAASVVPPTASPVTLTWQEQARSLVATKRVSTLAAGRIYAALSMAQNRAVEAVDALPAADVGRASTEARRGAVAGASARVLSFFFPSASPALDGMLAEQAAASASAAPPLGEPVGGRAHPQFERGVSIGRATGDAIIEHVQGDGFTTPWTGTVPVGPGIWIPNALPPAGATLGGVQPWFMASGSQFRPAPPPALSSTTFQTDLAEVVTLSQDLTPAQLAMVNYWDSPAGTPTPIGVWNVIAANLVEQHGLDERAAAEVFGLLQPAMFDSLIGCWEAKYHYWLLRPSHADQAVSLALPLPNFPSYPSGHSCISATAGRVLAHFFPDAADELTDMVGEAGLSRIIAGIHFRFDVTVGNELGYAVADLAINSRYRE